MHCEVARFYDPEEAIVAQSFLRSNGIDCTMQNNLHASVDPFLRVARGGIRLLAADEDKDLAIELLQGVSNVAPIADETFTPTRQVTALGRAAWLPVAFLMGVPFLPRKLGIRILFALLLIVFYWVQWPGVIR